MKAVIAMVCLGLISCGGQQYQQEKKSWEIEAELCEAQDGKLSLYHVMEIDTGQAYIDVVCEPLSE
jgi:uncharacterized protein (UPF0128 family)